MVAASASTGRIPPGSGGGPALDTAERRLQLGRAMTERATTRDRRRAALKPDPELWEAIGRGTGLTAILEDFYERVYADPRLAPFFEGTTKRRAIEKQYSFLRQIFTGESVYFGDRPRNAHHWMIISDELFDHREELFAECLRRRGLAEELVERWRGVHECFRKQIVKDAPRPKKLHGKAVPFEGHGELIIEVAFLCDGCGGALEPGSLVRYHHRTGRTYCAECVPATEAVGG